jgi:hypothetical protein
MKYYVLVALMCVTSFSFAQITMSGVVKDSIGQPLELTNVIAIVPESGGLESYSITDSKGYYKIILSQKLQIQVTDYGHWF